VPKTVTVKEARPGRALVVVGEYRFPLGEPVRDVPDDTVKRLRQMPGVVLHVTGSSRPAATPAQPSED
jgi:hypothetical protein